MIHVNTETHLPYGETGKRLSIHGRFGCTVLESRDVKKDLDAVGRDPEISIISGGPSTNPLLE